MVKLIFGLMGSSVAKSSASLSTLPGTIAFLTLLRAHDITELDTARVYNGGRQEELLGQVPAGLRDHFKISTKAPGFGPGTLAPENIRKNCEDSLEALGLRKCDIYYFHGPDRETPLEEQCRAVNELYRDGKFEKFGISNLSPDEVEKIYEICQKGGYVLPSVYQGGYNPLTRGAEERLFPLLRRFRMSFYAFSPLAGGFFAKPVKDLMNPAQGSRYDAMKHFGQMYLTDEAIAGREELEAICEKQGLTVRDATLRWLMHHCILDEADGVVLGAGTVEQAEANLKGAKGGPLPAEVVKCFDGLWDRVKEGAWQGYS